MLYRYNPSLKPYFTSECAAKTFLILEASCRYYFRSQHDAPQKLASFVITKSSSTEIADEIKNLAEEIIYHFFFYPDDYLHDLEMIEERGNLLQALGSGRKQAADNGGRVISAINVWGNQLKKNLVVQDWELTPLFESKSFSDLKMWDLAFPKIAFVIDTMVRFLTHKNHYRNFKPGVLFKPFTNDTKGCFRTSLNNAIEYECEIHPRRIPFENENSEIEIRDGE